jgi:nucleotide-binding universal stress UspA family protein
MASRVVVGVDGSPAAAVALAWAAEEAQLRGSELVVCTVLERASPSTVDEAAEPTPRLPPAEPAKGWARDSGVVVQAMVAGARMPARPARASLTTV